jgi:hypothetical protein
MDILDAVLTKHGLTPSMPSKQTPYDLGKDLEAIRTVIQSLRSSNVRVWYQHMNFSFRGFEDYIKTILDAIPMRCAGLEPTGELEAALRKDLAEEYDR